MSERKFIVKEAYQAQKRSDSDSNARDQNEI